MRWSRDLCEQILIPLQGISPLSTVHLYLQFCKDIEPGHSRAIECLEKHREEPGFSPKCKGDVEDLLAARIKDFRLDPQLKRVCAVDIEVRIFGQHSRAAVLTRAAQWRCCLMRRSTRPSW